MTKTTKSKTAKQAARAVFTPATPYLVVNAVHFHNGADREVLMLKLTANVQISRSMSGIVPLTITVRGAKHTTYARDARVVASADEALALIRSPVQTVLA